jgi:hypothetical protein
MDDPQFAILRLELFDEALLRGGVLLPPARESGKTGRFVGNKEDFIKMEKFHARIIPLQTGENA